jgi:hypothetical protein
MPVKQDYVIEVSGAPGKCWFAGFDDEADEGAQPQTTSDEAMAARYASFKEARGDVRILAEKHPQREFRVNVLEPLAAAENDHGGFEP